MAVTSYLNIVGSGGEKLDISGYGQTVVKYLKYIKLGQSRELTQVIYKGVRG